MSRVDVPTLKCDRCGDETQDTGLMMSYRKLTHYHMSGQDEWDLCPLCWAVFLHTVTLKGETADGNPEGTR